jgi:type II secretory pathway predicted ATPase ExeA
MYLTHFGLHEKPFKTGTDPKYLWLGEKLKEALATLVQGILHEDGFQEVTGSPGTGKTTVANAVLNELGDRVLAAVVTCPEYEGIDFLKLIAKAYGISGSLQGGDSFFQRFSEFLHSTFSSGKKVVLIIDEAQRLTPSCLKELSELARVEEDGARLFHIVFFGENRFHDILSEESNRDVLLNVTYSYALGPLSKEETAQYIRHRLQIAQCEGEIFTPEAIEEIFTYSQGVPLLINKACDASLTRSFYLGERIVRPETIRSFLKLMPEEKAAPGKEPSAQPQDVEAVAGSEPDKEILEDVRATIAAKSIMKPHWVRAAYVAVIAFLVVSVGFTIFLMQGKPPDSANVEAKKEVAPPASNAVERATTPSGDRGQVSESSVRQQAPGLSAEGRTLKGTDIQGTRAKKRETAGLRTSAEKARQASTERSRRESGDAAGDAGRGTSADSGETVSREPARQDTEKMESGEVIDWLIKKRSEQK